jgi:uncharacterized protein YcbK (DUF882 family)
LLKLRKFTIRNAGRLATTSALTLLLAALTPAQTQNAIANGDTRTIHLHHTHSGESIQATFRVNGQYDYAVLEKLNHFLRDWRNDDTIKMDPRLFDVVWETYRESGSQEPIQIVSAYRSPQTNAMLRRRSKAVAEFSQHMLGKAMDMHYLDVPMSRVREIAMRLQRGGVGYYPTAGSPFVHLDVGNVRAWPRMNYDQLARLFPDGKTVHLPTNGQPLARYDEARAELESRGGASMPSMAQVQSKGFFATLFGGGEEEETVAPAPRGGPRSRVAAYVETRNQPRTTVASSFEDDSSATYFRAEANRSPVIQQAERNLQRGETWMAPAPAPAATPAMAAAPVPPARPADAIAEQSRQIAAFDPRGAEAPVPPRRPSEAPLAQLAALNTPLPPTRPLELRPPEPPMPEPRPAALRQPEPRIAELRLQELRPAETQPPEPTRIARSAELPVIITGPAASPAAPPAPALAYAAIAEPPAPAPRPSAVGARAATRATAPRSELVAAKLDRGTLAALIKAVSVAQIAAPARTGPGASRADITRAIFAQPAQVTAGFDTSAGGLPTAAFTGRAVGPVAQEAQARDRNMLARRMD